MRTKPRAKEPLSEPRAHEACRVSGASHRAPVLPARRHAAADTNRSRIARPGFVVGPLGYSLALVQPYHRAWVHRLPKKGTRFSCGVRFSSVSWHRGLLGNATTGVAMRTHYVMAAGWLITSGLGIVPAPLSNFVATDQSALRANVPGGRAGGVPKEALPDVRGCEFGKSALTEGPRQQSIPTTTGCLVSP